MNPAMYPNDYLFLAIRNALAELKILGQTTLSCNDQWYQLKCDDTINTALPEPARHLLRLAQLPYRASMTALPNPPQSAYTLSNAMIAYFIQHLEHATIMKAEQNVPLKDLGNCRVMVFETLWNDLTHVAICVGQQIRNTDTPPLVRIHSSCFTGDILGSLRCDCGEQLRSGLLQMAQQGNGILLYLDQEGRGIGLANKMHAYKLQDSGHDTMTANELLGFDADGRNFTIAADILRHLHIGRLRLMTNNPDKANILTMHGLDIAQIIAMPAKHNPHNQKYLETKQQRCGHQTLLIS